MQSRTDKINLDKDAGCCDDPHIGGALTLEEALARIREDVAPIGDAENVPLPQALNRVLAEDVVSSMNVPGHTNSAMDGYAVRAGDLPATGNASLKVIGTSWAGRPFEDRVATGECVRIMTGAAMPDEADTVIMQEHVDASEDTVVIDDRARPGQHVRKAGEDIAAGAVALPAGTLLRPAQLGVMASIGCGEAVVIRRPRVAFFSTGDELRPVGEDLRKGQIYDSNRYTIRGMLERLGLEVIDLGVVPDRREDTETALNKASASADVIVTSGGVSVGEADFVTETLDRMGQVNFWKVAIKPGRPLAFGRVGGALFFGLPGNPVSVMATFYQIVQPTLEILTGNRRVDPPILLDAVCQSALRKKPGRLEVQRGVLERAPEGHYVVSSTGLQGSGVLSSMIEGNCFIVLPLELETVEPGDTVKVQPFRGLT